MDPRSDALPAQSSTMLLRFSTGTISSCLLRCRSLRLPRTPIRRNVSSAPPRSRAQPITAPRPDQVYRRHSVSALRPAYRSQLAYHPPAHRGIQLPPSPAGRTSRATRPRAPPSGRSSSSSQAVSPSLETSFQRPKEPPDPTPRLASGAHPRGVGASQSARVSQGYHTHWGKHSRKRRFPRGK